MLWPHAGTRATLGQQNAYLKVVDSLPSNRACVLSWWILPPPRQHYCCYMGEETAHRFYPMGRAWGVLFWKHLLCGWIAPNTEAVILAYRTRGVMLRAFSALRTSAARGFHPFAAKPVLLGCFSKFWLHSLEFFDESP